MFKTTVAAFYATPRGDISVGHFCSV